MSQFNARKSNSLGCPKENMEYIYDFLGVTQKISQSQKLVGGYDPSEEY